jgi:hypothetical protein
MPSILVAHPVPRGHGPAIVGTLVVVLALPVFLITGWNVASWALAAVLWFAGQGLMWVLLRMPLGMGNLGSSGAVAFGRMLRSFAMLGILLVVTVSNPSLGLPAVAVYAAAYTAEFGSSLVTYFGGGATTT